LLQKGMPMNAGEHFQAGDLPAAIAAATEAVKSSPSDQTARGLLAELLCFSGDLERADKQLDALMQLDPQTGLGATLFRQLIRAEQARQDFFRDGRVPEVLEQPSPHLQLRLKASVALRAGETREAEALIAEAEEGRTAISGQHDGERFEDFRDLDDLTASVFEVLTSTGKYFWIPMDLVELIEFRPYERPRDLLWRRCRMIVRNGPDGEVYLPTLYAGTKDSTDQQVRLGRATDWQGESLVRGAGQRTFLVGEQDKPILELGTLEFDTHGN
jgi:type VI secretion system protein ImpE